MIDDPEKIANASLHQRAAMMAEIDRLQAENTAMNAVGAQLLEALSDISELVEDKADIDRNGHANLAMQILTIVQVAMSTK